MARIVSAPAAAKAGEKWRTLAIGDELHTYSQHSESDGTRFSIEVIASDGQAYRLEMKRAEAVAVFARAFDAHAETHGHLADIIAEAKSVALKDAA